MVMLLLPIRESEKESVRVGFMSVSFIQNMFHYLQEHNHYGGITIYNN